MRMKTIRLDDSITHVALVGRLDVPGVTEVQFEFHQVTTLAPKPTIVDVSEVTYIASLGLGMLLSAAKYCERHGVRLVLLGPKPTVKAAFVTAGLAHLIPVADDEPAALALLR